MKRTFLVALLCSLFFVVNAQDPGTLDPTFGDDGIAYFAQSNNMDVPAALLVQEDGKIVIVGKSRYDNMNFYVSASRLNADGTIDETFGTNGHTYIQVMPTAYKNEGRAAVLTEDGSIIVVGHIFDGAGTNRSFVLQLDQNGYLNTYFGDEGITLSENNHGIVYEGVDVDSQGRIVVTGYRDDKILATRYTPEGQLDTTFGDGGTTVVEFDGYLMSYGWTVRCDEDDNILIGASRVLVGTDTNRAIVCKLDDTGALDASFGSEGCVNLAVGEGHDYALAIDFQDGDYIVAGHTWLANEPNLRYAAFVTRVSQDGDIDNSFGDNGFIKMEPHANSSHYCYDVKVAEDGQIFGTFYSFYSENYIVLDNGVYVFNLDADGQLNTAFDGDGILELVFDSPEVETKDVALQADGKLLVAGYIWDGNVASDVLVARIHTDVNPGAPAEPSTVEVEVEVLGPHSAMINVTPDENTVDFYASVVSQADYELAGEDAIVNLMIEQLTPMVGEVELTIEGLESETDYVALAFGYNADDEMGEVTVVPFTTEFDNVNEVENNSYSIYPNPVSSVLFVNSGSDSNAVLSIIDMTGRCVKEVEINGNASVNVEDINKGVYFVKIQSESNQTIQKIVVE